MSLDFSTLPDRSGTGSLKWEKYAGREVLPLWVADMDFFSPPAVISALEERARHGVFGYTLPYASVIESVVHWMSRRYDDKIDPLWLYWLPGLVPALNVMARAYCAENEAVMTCTPVYPPFLTAPVWQGRQLISVPLAVVNNRYTFDLDAMEAAVTPETRVFVLCNPHNPVGRVYQRAELEAVARFCERHDLVLVSDEIHADLILNPDCRHVGIRTLGRDVADRTVTLHAPSKTFNLPGLACSFAVIENANLRAKFQRAARGTITEINAMGYTGCEAAYRHGEPWLDALLEQLRNNRDLVYQFAGEHMPRLGLLPMEATYLAWFDVRPLHLENAMAHFESHGIGLSDGQHFGVEGWLRLNFGCPKAMLREGLRRMKLAYDAAVA